MDQDVQEINLINLMFYCLKRWRMIIVPMVLVAAIMSGFKYRTEVRNNQIKQEQAEKEGKDLDTVSFSNPLVSAVESLIVGFILGGLFASFILILIYMSNGKLQDIENFKKEFDIPFLGSIRETKQGRGVFGFIDRWIIHLEDRAFANISLEEQIEIAAINIRTAVLKKIGDHEKIKIMIAGTVTENEITEVYLKLKTQIKTIEFSEYKQLVLQASAMKELEIYDGILFLEKRDVSIINLIKREKEIALEREIKILGGVILL